MPDLERKIILFNFHLIFNLIFNILFNILFNIKLEFELFLEIFNPAEHQVPDLERKIDQMEEELNDLSAK